MTFPSILFRLIDFLIPKQSSQSLAYYGARKFFSEFDHFRHFVSRQILPTVIPKLFFGSGLAFDQLNKSLNRLTAVLIRNTDGDYVLDFGMREEDLIDVPRIDVESACDNHILGPVNNEHIAIFILISNVTGAQPAILELI